jgi:murein L,D-transpeptidase YcbB/YkuD
MERFAKVDRGLHLDESLTIHSIRQLSGSTPRGRIDASTFFQLTGAMAKILTQFAIALVASALFSAANAKVLIRVDLDAQTMTVTENDGQTHVWKVSSGRDGFETPTGTFNVQRLDANHFSDEYDQSPMPYSIFFYEGIAIHGTYQRGLGRPASHGCIRLSVPNARMLYSWVEKYGAAITVMGMTASGETPEIYLDNRQSIIKSPGHSNRSWIEVSQPD